MPTNPVHSLSFGDIVMVEEGANPPDDSGIVYRVRAQDASLGTAIPVTVALLSLMRQGSDVEYDHTPNREPVFRITVEADDSNLVALGEQRLQKQAEQRCELKWTPPDGAGATSVLDVVWSHIEPLFDVDGLTGLGMEEVFRRGRTWLLKMQALPYARGGDLVVTPAQTTATETVIDDGSSTTGWATSISSLSGQTVALSIVSGRVTSTVTGSGGAAVMLTRTGVIDVSTQKYIAFDVAVSVTYTPTITMDAGFFAGGRVLPIVSQLSLGGGLTRYFVVVPPEVSTISSLWFHAGNAFYVTGSTVAIDKVSRWTGLPAIGTARQKVMSLVPGGSVRAEGTVQAQHASSALGWALVYTYPSGSGYLPPLRTFRVSGTGPTTDANRVSGARNTIGTATVFRIPAALIPDGLAAIVGFLAPASGGSTTLTVTTTIQGYMGSTAVGPTQQQVSALNTYTATTYRPVMLGSFTLPPSRLGPAGFVQVTIQQTAGAVNLELDEAWLFALNRDTALTIVDCGTGSPAAGGDSNRLWIEAPSLDEQFGALWVGNAADKSDARYPGDAVQGWGGHVFPPQGASVLTVTSNALDAETSLSHYPRDNTFRYQAD